MGILDRFSRRATPPTGGPTESSQTADDQTSGEGTGDDVPLSPKSHGLGDAERARIETGLSALAAEGVDVDDLRSIGHGLDQALTDWMERDGADHDEIVERYAVGLGEHLTRHTDLSWQVVTDAFGTDLAVSAGDFVVVPHNLVAMRWIRRERGWVPDVIGHLLLVRRR